MFKISENANQPYMGILAEKDGCQLICRAVDSENDLLAGGESAVQRLFEEVLTPFYCNCSSAETINEFFTQVLAGTTPRAALQEIRFFEDHIEIIHAQHHFQRNSKGRLRDKTYSNRTTYSDTFLAGSVSFALEIDVLDENSEIVEAYAILFCPGVINISPMETETDNSVTFSLPIAV